MKLNELRSLQRRGITLKKGIARARRKERELTLKYDSLHKRAKEVWAVPPGSVIRARGTYYWVVDAVCARGFHVEPSLMCRRWIKASRDSRGGHWSSEATWILFSEAEEVLLQTGKNGWIPDSSVMPGIEKLWKEIKGNRGK